MSVRKVNAFRKESEGKIFLKVSRLCVLNCVLNCENYIELANHTFRVVIRIEPMRSLFTRPTCQTNQRVQQPNIRVHSAYVPNA